MAFVKTTWVQGQAPYINAAQLNRIEQGVDDLYNAAYGLGLVSPALEAFHVVGAAGQPAFQNGWGNFGGGLSVAAFYKDPHGIVHLKGQVANGAVGSNVFTLPAGYRPAERIDPACGTSGGSSFVTIGSNGTIVPTAGAGNSRVCLDAITFRAEV